MQKYQNLYFILKIRSFVLMKPILKIIYQLAFTSQQQQTDMKHSEIIQSKPAKSKSQFYPKMEEISKKQEIRLQNQSLKMLLYRNRSLKLLFGEISPKNRYDQVEKHAKKVHSPKNSQLPKSKNKDKLGATYKQRVNYADKNEYMIVSHRSKEQFDRLVRPNKANNLKGHLKREDKNTQSHIQSIKQVQVRNEGKEAKYNADDYNWRKSLSKQKDHFQPIGSPRSIVPLRMSHQEYYPSKNNSNNQTKQTPAKINSNRRTAKSKSLSNHYYRDNSPLSKPKVIRHVFDPKNKRQPCQSPKSLLFTFGI